MSQQHEQQHEQTKLDVSKIPYKYAYKIISRNGKSVVVTVNTVEELFTAVAENQASNYYVIYFNCEDAICTAYPSGVFVSKEFITWYDENNKEKINVTAD